MSNQVHLYTTNLVSAQDIFEDCIDDGGQHQFLLEAPGNVPALLWIPMFNNVVWQQVLDTDEDDEEGSVAVGGEMTP